jgi:hypothetical protein
MTKKDEKLVLPKEARLMMCNFLESQNKVGVDNWEDATIMDEYNKAVLAMQKNMQSLTASAETKNINSWLSENPNVRVTNNDFLMRLYNLNVPHFYLHLFKDDDADLSNTEIWRIINKSGINPLTALNKDKSVLHRNGKSPLRPKLTVR